MFVIFNHILAAISKLFTYSPTSSIVHLLLFALLDLQTLLQMLLLYGIMCSPHSLLLYPHLPCTPTSPSCSHSSPLLSSSSVPFLHSYPAPLSCRCHCHASFISSPLRYPVFLKKPCKGLAAFSKSLQTSLESCPTSVSVYSRLFNSDLASHYVTSDKSCS